MTAPPTRTDCCSSFSARQPPRFSCCSPRAASGGQSRTKPCSVLWRASPRRLPATQQLRSARALRPATSPPDAACHQATHLELSPASRQGPDPAEPPRCAGAHPALLVLEEQPAQAVRPRPGAGLGGCRPPRHRVFQRHLSGPRRRSERRSRSRCEPLRRACGSAGARCPGTAAEPADVGSSGRRSRRRGGQRARGVCAGDSSQPSISHPLGPAGDRLGARWRGARCLSGVQELAASLKSPYRLSCRNAGGHSFLRRWRLPFRRRRPHGVGRKATG